MDALGEVVAYQAVLRQVALEWLRTSNPDAKRAPIEARIAISGITRKCCQIDIEPDARGNLLNPAPLKVWVEQANRTVNEVAAGRFDGFSTETLEAVARLGSSFKPDEYLRFDDREDVDGAYTKKARRRLTDHLNTPPVADRRFVVGTVIGVGDRRLPGVKGMKRCVDFVTLEGHRFTGPTYDNALMEAAKRAYVFAQEERPLVRFKLQGLFLGNAPLSIDEVQEVSPLPGPEVAHRLAKIAALPDDWDGDGAESVPQERIDRARRFLSIVLGGAVSRTPTLAPGPNGELVMEWAMQRDPRRSLGVLFDAEREFQIYAVGEPGAFERSANPTHFENLYVQGLRE